MEIVDELVELIKKLRDPEQGCPWDIKQTKESLAPCLIEEAWEVVDAILNNGNIMAELGDVLLNILLQCQISSEKKEFDFANVCKALKQKIISKHPHVFLGQSKSEREILESWEKDKKNPLSIPLSMPATLRAKIASEKAARLGIKFTSEEEIFEKLKEELNELKMASNPENFIEELGDLLFALVELGRVRGVDAEQALNLSTNKFIRRVKKALTLKDPELDQEAKWQQAKK
ncbi:MAG: nucleoside triphosphate pyrophosphohydrolase [Deltaproteobacteria bacterium]|nr:nucleoside triphosphate pyrophosphohydrolase [Deltaproteobacteria bacterium]